MRKFLTAVLLIGILGSLSAYVLVGHTWAQTPVPYYVNTSNIFGLSDASIVDAVQRGASAWNTVGTSLQLQYAGASSITSLVNDGTNNVFFRNDTNGSFIAETYWWYDGTGHLVDFDIVYHEALVPMFPDATTCSGGISILETGMHELGHGIGFGHSDISDAIMYGGGVGYCDPRTSLASDDIVGLMAMYGSTPTPTPAPAPAPPPTPTDLRLIARAYKVKGVQNVDLSWSGLLAPMVDIYRNGVNAVMTVNDGAYTDNLNRRGSGIYVYKVCDIGTTTCTNTAQAVF